MIAQLYHFVNKIDVKIACAFRAFAAKLCFASRVLSALLAKPVPSAVSPLRYRSSRFLHSLRSFSPVAACGVAP